MPLARVGLSSLLSSQLRVILQRNVSAAEPGSFYCIFPPGIIDDSSGYQEVKRESFRMKAFTDDTPSEC